MLRRLGDGDPAAAVMATAALDGLADNALRAGDLDRAAERFEEALARARASGITWTQADVLGRPGRRGAAPRGAGAGGGAVPGRRWRCSRLGLADERRRSCAVEAWRGARRAGQPERAARLLGAAEALQERRRSATAVPRERTRESTGRRRARAALGEEPRSPRPGTAGRALSLEQAVAEALAPAAERGAARAGRRARPPVPRRAARPQAGPLRPDAAASGRCWRLLLPAPDRPPRSPTRCSSAPAPSPPTSPTSSTSSASAPAARPPPSPPATAWPEPRPHPGPPTYVKLRTPPFPDLPGIRRSCRCAPPVRGA